MPKGITCIASQHDCIGGFKSSLANKAIYVFEGQDRLGCWVVGLLGCWVVGLLGCWVVGWLRGWVVVKDSDSGGHH